MAKCDKCGAETPDDDLWGVNEGEIKKICDECFFEQYSVQLIDYQG